MPTYGLTATGFYSKPLSAVDDELDAGLRSILGQDAGTDADGKIPFQSMAGQLKALLLDGFSAQWDLQEAVVASVDPNRASGVFQDAVCAFTGVTREPARRSVATGLCVGNPDTSLSAGRAATVAGTASRFSTPTGVVLATGTQWYTSSGYSLGNIAYKASRTYQCITAGIASSGPSGTASDITDGTAHWKHLGLGIGVAQIPFVADQVGAIGVATGSLSEIATPVSGWNALTNLLAADVGALQEADSALRVRREQELATSGNTTVDAIRANVLAVNEGSDDPNHEPATAVHVFANNTDFTDGDGVPPHTIEVLVYGGTDADIAQAIWESVGAGTATYGNQTSTVYDSENVAQTVYWSRPTNVPIWVTAVGRYDASSWPPASETVVAQSMLSSLLTYTATWPISRDVRTSPLNGAMMRGPAGTTGGLAVVPADQDADPTPGLLEVESLLISTASGPTGSGQLTIGPRQIATFDASRCAITATSEDP